MTARTGGLDTAASWWVWGAAVFAYLTAVTQRTSFGVAGLEATERFGATASVLAAFSVVQLVVYAGLQIPVGVLVDRLGPRTMIAGGAVLMVVGQGLLAIADSVAAGIVGRFFVGAGDAMTFVSVMRLLPAWFSGYRVPMLTQFTGMLGQLGQLVSLVPFVAFLRLSGWTTSFLSLAALGVLSFALAVIMVRNQPDAAVRPDVGARPKSLAMLAGAWREPGTRLGFWTHFSTQFSTNVFLLAWGYPFLVSGQGLAPAQASGLMSIFVVVALVAGPLFGGAVARHPLRRSTLAFGIIAGVAIAWGTVLLWPGPAPVWVLAIMIVLVALGGPGSMIGFDFARTFNPPNITGTATGLVNVGGFLAALVTVYAVGAILDVRYEAAGGTGQLYNLDAFRWALAFQFVPLLLGTLGMVLSRRKARSRMAERGIVVPRWRDAIARRRRKDRGLDGRER